MPAGPSVFWYALASVTLVSLRSLAGMAVISLIEEKLRWAIFVMVALAAGGLFGDSFSELLPESYASGPPDGPALDVGLVADLQSQNEEGLCLKL